MAIQYGGSARNLVLQRLRRAVVRPDGKPVATRPVFGRPRGDLGAQRIFETIQKLRTPEGQAVVVPELKIVSDTQPPPPPPPPAIAPRVVEEPKPVHEEVIAKPIANGDKKVSITTMEGRTADVAIETVPLRDVSAGAGGPVPAAATAVPGAEGAPKEGPNVLLFVGLGVGALALGVVVFALTRKG